MGRHYIVRLGVELQYFLGRPDQYGFLLYYIPEIMEKMYMRPGGFDGEWIVHYEIPDLEQKWIVKDVNIELVLYDLCLMFSKNYDHCEVGRIAAGLLSTDVVLQDGEDIEVLHTTQDFLARLRLIWTFLLVTSHKLGGEKDIRGNLIPIVDGTIGERFIIIIIVTQVYFKTKNGGIFY